MMSKVFAILGSGMQGTAAAYDIARFGDPETIWMADVDPQQAERNASRVNALVGRDVCRPKRVDALNVPELREFLRDVDVLVSCVPYWMHPRISPVAVETRTSMVDMGGSTEIALKTLEGAKGAAEAGVAVVPDTGLAPGMVNDIGSYLMEQMDEPEDIRLYCGGLPQDPKPPFNYKLVFNIEGLVVEYSGQADVLRDGKLIKVETLTELEEIDHPRLGKLEAFVTSGGASTAPFTLQGKVANYQYKTFRYPGHCALMKVFKDFGFWGEEPIETRAGKAVPREVFHALMGPGLSRDGKDLIVVRGIGKGKKNGQPFEKTVDILDYHDDETGFSAMERMTGFSTSIYAIAIAQGVIPPGAHRYETAMSGAHYMSELRKRPFSIEES